MCIEYSNLFSLNFMEMHLLSAIGQTLPHNWWLSWSVRKVLFVNYDHRCGSIKTQCNKMRVWISKHGHVSKRGSIEFFNFIFFLINRYTNHTIISYLKFLGEDCPKQGLVFTTRDIKNEVFWRNQPNYHISSTKGLSLFNCLFSHLIWKQD